MTIGVFTESQSGKNLTLWLNDQNITATLLTTDTVSVDPAALNKISMWSLVDRNLFYVLSIDLNVVAGAVKYSAEDLIRNIESSVKTTTSEVSFKYPAGANALRISSTHTYKSAEWDAAVAALSEVDVNVFRFISAGTTKDARCVRAASAVVTDDALRNVVATAANRYKFNTYLPGSDKEIQAKWLLSNWGASSFEEDLVIWNDLPAEYQVLLVRAARTASSTAEKYFSKMTMAKFNRS